MEWTDPTIHGRNRFMALEGELFAPLLLLPVLPASRAAARPCTHVLLAPLSEASSTRAPKLGLALAAHRRGCFMCSQAAECAAGSTSSSPTKCSTSWSTTDKLDKLSGIIFDRRRSTPRSDERDRVLDLCASIAYERWVLVGVVGHHCLTTTTTSCSK